MERGRPVRLFLRIITVLVGIALILSAYAITHAATALARILLFVLAGTALLIAAFFLYLLILAFVIRKKGRNYFLYDRKRGGNMAPEDLTSAHVSERILRYMALFRQGRQLYITSLFDEEGGAPEVFKPLFCYQLLCMMATCHERAQWNAFLDGGKELADVFSTYLLQANEEELSREVQYHMAHAEGDSRPFQLYLQSKKDYLLCRMLEYTKQHLHEFE
ncbi:MAG: hypothetical protein IKB75_00885 [Clostridia bacterium]|nr:hypothetical protein [Clostridia bacterium]